MRAHRSDFSPKKPESAPAEHTGTSWNTLSAVRKKPNQKHDGNRCRRCCCCTQSMWQQQRWRQHVDSFHIRIESTRSAKTVRRQEGQAWRDTDTDTHTYTQEAREALVTSVKNSSSCLVYRTPSSIKKKPIRIVVK